MSCWYDRHGCGPHAHGHDGPGPCDHVSWRPVDWLDETDLPMDRGFRRQRRSGQEAVAADLGARLEHLRLMVGELEAELLAMDSSGGSGSRE